MSKRERADALTIEGQKTVTLDFSQMNPRLLYARAGLAQPMADAYVLPPNRKTSEAYHSVASKAPKMGPKRYRSTGKLMFNAMAYTSGPLARMPGGMRKSIRLHTSVKLEHFVQAMKEFHSPIAHLFERGEGMRGMFDESQIMMATLLRLKEQGVVALPVHDAVIVRADCEEVAMEAMKASFMSLTGQQIEVCREMIRPRSSLADDFDEDAFDPYRTESGCE